MEVGTKNPRIKTENCLRSVECLVSMRGRMKNIGGTRKFLSFAVLISAIVLFVVLMAWAQETKAPKPAPAAKATGQNGQVAHGKYIVEEVAKCVNCHTPRDANGEIDTARQLMGAPVFFQPAQPVADWPQICPRIGGTPPGTDQEMVTLLTTGIWNTGRPLRDPMPKFHMTREDAEAVVAYLKSLK
jgi:mono/diheme cytochrome c family protein